MSRKVDPTAKNLSDDDKRYLVQRGLVSDSTMPVSEQRKLVDPDLPSLEDRANTGDVNTANLSIEDLERLLKAKRAEQDAVEPKSLFGSASGATPEEEDDEDEDEEISAPYDGYVKSQLSAEIARRNEGRDEDDQITVEPPANKAEFIAALEADDEAQSEDDEDEE